MLFYVCDMSLNKNLGLLVVLHQKKKNHRFRSDLSVVFRQYEGINYTSRKVDSLIAHRLYLMSSSSWEKQPRWWPVKTSHI